MLDSTVDVKEVVAQARRTQILQGAAQVFAEKGYHKATTKQIAKAAGVSEGTIYNYFQNKRELLFALLQLIAMQPVHDIVAQFSDDPKEVLQQLLLNRFTILQEQSNLFAPIIAELFLDEDLRVEFFQQMVLPLATLLENYFQAQVEAGRFRSFDARIATRTIVGAMMLNSVITLSKLDTRAEPLPPEEMITQLTELFLHGIEEPTSKPSATGEATAHSS